MTKPALNISSSGLGDLENPELHSQSKGFKSLSAVPSKRKRKKPGLNRTYWFCPECGRKKSMRVENCRHGN